MQSITNLDRLLTTFGLIRIQPCRSKNNTFSLSHSPLLVPVLCRDTLLGYLKEKNLSKVSSYLGTSSFFVDSSSRGSPTRRGSSFGPNHGTARIQFRAPFPCDYALRLNQHQRYYSFFQVTTIMSATEVRPKKYIQGIWYALEHRFIATQSPS